MGIQILPIEVWSRIVHILVFDLRSWTEDPLQIIDETEPATHAISEFLFVSNRIMQPGALILALVCRQWRTAIQNDQRLYFVQVYVRGSISPDAIIQLNAYLDPWSQVQLLLVLHLQNEDLHSGVLKVIHDYRSRLQVLSAQTINKLGVKLVAQLMRTSDFPYLQYLSLLHDEFSRPLLFSQSIQTLAVPLDALPSLTYAGVYSSPPSFIGDVQRSFSITHLYLDNNENSYQRSWDDLCSFLHAVPQLEILEMRGNWNKPWKRETAISPCLAGSVVLANLLQLVVEGHLLAVMEMVFFFSMPQLKTLVLKTRERANSSDEWSNSLFQTQPLFPRLSHLEICYLTPPFAQFLTVAKLPSLSLLTVHHEGHGPLVALDWPPLQAFDSLSQVNICADPGAINWLLKSLSWHTRTRPTRLVLFISSSEENSLLSGVSPLFLQHVQSLELFLRSNSSYLNIPELYGALSNLESLILGIQPTPLRSVPKAIIPPLYSTQPEANANANQKVVILPRLTTLCFLPGYHLHNVGESRLEEYVKERAAAGAPLEKLVLNEALNDIEHVVERLRAIVREVEYEPHTSYTYPEVICCNGT